MPDRIQDCSGKCHGAPVQHPAVLVDLHTGHGTAEVHQETQSLREETRFRMNMLSLISSFFTPRQVFVVRWVGNQRLTSRGSQVGKRVVGRRCDDSLLQRMPYGFRGHSPQGF